MDVWICTGGCHSLDMYRYVYNDTSKGVEVGYGCVDMHQGDVLAWTCTGMCILTQVMG